MVSRRNRRLGAIEGTLTVVATICFLPCICVIGGGIIAKDLFGKARKYERPKTRRARESKARKKQVIRSTPKALGPRLEHHLTIGRPEPEEEVEDTDLKESKDVEAVKLSRALTVTEGQEQSPLFRLPFELRQKIYEEAVGGYMIHIYFVEAYRRMSHARCNRFSDTYQDFSEHDPLCRGVVKIGGVADKWGNISLLSLMKSCRRVYSEAIEILYTRNCFDFGSLNDVLKLSLTLLPERMRLINMVQWKTTVASTNNLNTTPWLDCRKPSTCCCITCWPKAIGVDDDAISRYQLSTFEYPLPKSGWRICQ